jgi:hypothetical protein
MSGVTRDDSRAGHAALKNLIALLDPPDQASGEP